MPGKDLAYLALQALEREESMYEHINFLFFFQLCIIYMYLGILIYHYD